VSFFSVQTAFSIVWCSIILSLFEIVAALKVKGFVVIYEEEAAEIFCCVASGILGRHVVSLR
jgi:hypothetical protein